MSSMYFTVVPPGIWPAPVAGVHRGDAWPVAGSTVAPGLGAQALAPRVRVAPRRRALGLAADRLEHRRALPRVARRGRGRGGRRGVAHEALDRRDDRGGLLGGGGRGDDLE